MDKRKVYAEVLMICLIVVLSILIAHRWIIILSNNNLSINPSQNLNLINISSVPNPLLNLASSYNGPYLSSSIIDNEYVFSTSIYYKSNFWFNEKFYPGNISDNSGSYSCSAVNKITAATHLCLSLFTLFSCGGGPKTSTFNNLVGYLGFPQADNNFPKNGGVNFSNLYSATSNGSSQNIYQLPSPKFPYQNFIDWSSSTIHSYDGTDFIYAINNSFTGYPDIAGSIPKSTLIIPAVSCGSTFINNYIPFLGFVGTLYNISTLSGFTPSVFLASSNQNAYGADYALGYLLNLGNDPWVDSFNSLLAYQVQSISPAFRYTMPSVDYAQFPKGNNGDIQYLNVSTDFLTPLSLSYYGGNSTNVEIYVSNKGISSLLNTSRSQTICTEEGPHGACLRYGQDVITTQTADTFTSPDLEGVYYPNYDNGIYLQFRTDGIFPICAWNSSTGNTLSSCTFENPSTINNISYERLWLSNNLKNNQLYNASFTPGYSSSSPENSFTLTALNSFCFYGENFNTNSGVYTSPSYTRIIPSTVSENYTTAIGTCNAFFNNTNCFSKSASQYLNFEDGIFANNIKCTSTGIHAQNVTDAWINSIYVANNAGDYCGLFKGQKNPSNPEADSTLFLQDIGTNCPEFNANSSSVNLVITVKNVGNTKIKDPYLVALYGNNNLSTIFYNSENSESITYELYQDFLSSMSATTGVIQVNYNNNFDTNMYVFDKGYPLNPIPIESLFSSAQGYENGPFNNSLLGMWIYDPGSGIPNNVVRTSNALLVHSDSGNSNVPVIEPNGSATFTLQVPMSLFRALLSGKYNLSVFFGNTFNVTWDGSASPSGSLASNIPVQVNPLVSSSTQSVSETHNNEIITNGSGAISPIWQYIVSYNFDLSKSPMKGIGIYSDNLSINVNAVNSTSNALNITVNPSVSVTNGSGSYKLGLNQLKGSSISCFASPDNVQDFGVFWSKQIVSPSNLNYALSNSLYYGNAKQASNVLITSWTGILFMPYSDQVALNYNNLPKYSSSISSFQLEKPTLNQTSGNFNYEAFAYFGIGSENNVFSNLSKLYGSLNSTVSSFPVSLPNSSLPFNLFSNSIVSDPSILRIVGTDTLVNYSNFSNKSFTFSLFNKGSINCSVSESTSTNATFESDSSSSVSSCLSNAIVNNSYINISSKYGPFFVDMYNNSNLNMSNETYNGTVLMAANETLSAPSKNGLFVVKLPINATIKNGIALVFSVIPLSRQLYNSTLYLYNVNGTPFNCNIVNDYNNTGNLGVTKINDGEYFLPNGTIMCNLNNDFTYLRAVFINKSNNAYLGSGDIQSGLSIQNISGNSKKGILNLSIDGVPVNAQDLSIIPHNNNCNAIEDNVIYNGIVQYNPGCNLSDALITFDYNNNGNLIPESAFISPANYNSNSKKFLFMNPSSIPDFPIAEYNLTIPSSGIGNEPIQFVLSNNFGGCNNIRVVTQSPYPYAEVPFQIISSSSQSCDYIFIGNSNNKYSVFESNYPSIPYNSNWISYNSTQYSVQMSTNLFNADLISNCQSGFGPCLDSFSLNGKMMGNLLFNNVSTSSARIYQTTSGPVEDCFTVSYSSSQTIEFPETGFGNINYDNNKIYQTATPSQSISSMYCFYANSPIITDSISAQGSPINFKVQNQLISNFSYLQDNNNQVFYVPPAIKVGYNAYGKVNISTLSPVYYNITTLDNILTKCINYTSISSKVMDLTNSQISAINISSTNILTPENLYCIYGGTPSYTPQASLSSTNNMNSTSLIGFAYQPGNYTNGKGTFYDSCSVRPDLTVSGSPTFYLNGKEEPYDFSSTENYTMNLSATNNGLEMLYSPTGGVLIDSCPSNSTILSYSTCTKPVTVIPSNGSYDSLEAIPTGEDGNLSFGGGCYIGTLNGNSYSCTPTDGAINYYYKSKSAHAFNVSISKIVLNSTEAPTSTFSISFDCSIDATNGSKLQFSSCSYPNNKNSGLCSASVSYKTINSTAYNITAMCYSVSNSSFKITSAVTNISNLNINGSQSEKTGLISNYICGNETNVIEHNVFNGWTWKPYSTTGSVNPVTTTNSVGIAEVGGCEAGRDTFVTSNPTITLKRSGDSFEDSYSCQSGYTGTITACSQKMSLSEVSSLVNPNSACSYTNTTLINTTIKTTTINGNGTGGQATACNPFNKPGYIQPTLQNNCIAYHNPVINSTTASYVLQYINSSNLGIGLGVIESKYALNISIPDNKQQNLVKDAYFAGLSESQIEGPNDIFTNILPTSLLESNLPSKALSISAAYSYDMLNILMLQNPSLGVSGIPGFVNGSILDYALSLFTGGTSGNCAPPYNVSGDGIFRLGEGELCSGKTLPASYKEGIFLSLGTLNEGLHSLQFYSIGNATNEAQPSASIFDSVGTAVNLNSACTNGNNRVFTSTYSSGKWSFNITSDQQCNPINSQLYGYIVNCLYQTPGNETYTIASQYYLAYNLPTIWNISYSLLVSPKSYQVVPTPVYQINYSTGSILTLQQPNKTTFIEKGLPKGYKWYLSYNGVNRSSTVNNIYFYSIGKHNFNVYTLSNSSVIPDCYTTYTPTPSSGSVTSGTTTYLQFIGITTCYSYFKQSGLPKGLNWNVTYNKIIGSTYMSRPLTPNSGGSLNPNNNSEIEFITNNTGGFGGNFSFSVPNIKTTSAACTKVYEPAPSSGYLLAGTNESIIFSLYSDTCITTFKETGLPTNKEWDVDYNGTTKTSTKSTITFVTHPGSLPYFVSAPSNSSLGCTTNYVASPASGNLNASSSLSISFSSTTSCITTFTESGLPSGYNWKITYDSMTNNTKAPSNITFLTNTIGNSIPSFSYSVSNSTGSSTSGCTTSYIPSPSSGTVEAGYATLINFSGKTTCITTFSESNLPSGYNWKVSYDSNSNKASIGSPITITTPPGTFTASASVDGLSCTASASVKAGSSYTFSSWSCNTYFYVWTQSPLPSSNYNENVTFNGNSNIQNWGNDRVTLPNGETGLKFKFSGSSSTSTDSWSVNSPIDGIWGDCGFATGGDVWTANASSGNVYPGQSVYVEYSVSCVWNK